MREIFARSVQFWILVGGAIGGVTDYVIDEPRDWGVGLAIGMVVGGLLGLVLRKRRQ